MNENDIIYFEVNNWFSGRDYPAEEPFLSWMANDLKLTLADDEWCKEQKICVIKFNADMSMNFLVTATRTWCEKNCPCILEERNAEFIRHIEDDDDLCYSNLIESASFANYEESNFGSKWKDYDEEYHDTYCDYDDDEETKDED